MGEPDVYGRLGWNRPGRNDDVHEQPAQRFHVRRSQQSTNDLGQTFTYDATGQQATASYSGYSLQQTYDGRRVKKVENTSSTYYLRSTVLGGQIVAELNSSGAMTRGFVYQGGQLLAVQQNNQVSWVHEDPVAKSKRVTNSSGNVVSTVELDPGVVTRREAVMKHFNRDASRPTTRREQFGWLTIVATIAGTCALINRILTAAATT